MPREPDPPGIPLRADHPDGVFDADWYVRTYPDVEGNELPPWEHFLAFGDAEHRAPGPSFDPEFYSRTYLPLEAEHPAYHYIVYGRPRGYLTARASLTRRESAEAMRTALRRRPHPILLIGNDAQEAGAPILQLEVARHLRMRGFAPVFLLRRGGQLLDVFRAHGPTFIADEGWSLAGLGAAIPAGTPILASTGWGAELLSALSCRGTSAVLVHEMAAYLDEHDLLDAIGRAPLVIASMAVQQESLRARLPPTATLRLIRPGLSARRPSRRARDEVARFLEARWGTEAIIFIGAGYADRRKGFDLFLDAARGILEKEPRARFVWLGQLSGWARDLAEAAIDEGLPLLLPGFRPDATAWYANAHVYLLMSRQDPGPTTVMDAARTGTPFVGYEADIGLRGLGPLLDGVGEFVADRETLVRRAREIAAVDTVAARTRRAAHMREHGPFVRYIDELLAALRTSGALDEPSRVRQWIGGRSLWIRPIARRVLLRWHRLTTGIARLLGAPEPSVPLLRPVPGPWLHDAPEVTRAARPLVLAVGPDGWAPEDALADSDEVASLESGETAWLADAALLTHVPRPCVVHLLRSSDEAPWPVVSAVESATPAIVALHQYDAARGEVPQWLVRGDPPPPARWPRSAAEPRPHAVSLAPLSSSVARRPVGVFLHAYYVNLARRLERPIRRIPHEYQLYVSTDTPEKAQQLRAIFPDAEVRVVANRGRDIYPKLFAFADAHAHHDIVLHLHTKRSPHSAHLAEWRDHIVDRLLPSCEGVNAILALFDQAPELGMVSPAPYDGIRANYGWGSTLPIAQALTFAAGWKLPDNRDLAFPAGSMFWARAAALAPLHDLAIPQEAFVEGAGVLDGTLAHTVERLLGVSVAHAGLTQIQVDPADERTPGMTTPQAVRHVRRVHRRRS